MFEFSRLDAQNPEQVSKTLLWVFPAKVYKRGDNHSFKSSPTASVLILLVFRKMEWTRDIIFRLIELYRAHPFLWDPRNEHHKLKNKKWDAWTEISNHLIYLFSFFTGGLTAYFIRNLSKSHFHV